jgi:hypothetical protein
MILELLLLPSIVVSANLFVCAIFSIILPPAVKSDILCFLAARCFFALVRSACNRNEERKEEIIFYKYLEINHSHDGSGCSGSVGVGPQVQSYSTPSPLSRVSVYVCVMKTLIV